MRVDILALGALLVSSLVACDEPRIRSAETAINAPVQPGRLTSESLGPDGQFLAVGVDGCLRERQDPVVACVLPSEFLFYGTALSCRPHGEHGLSRIELLVKTRIPEAQTAGLTSLWTGSPCREIESLLGSDLLVGADRDGDRMLISCGSRGLVPLDNPLETIEAYDARRDQVAAGCQSMNVQRLTLAAVDDGDLVQSELDAIAEQLQPMEFVCLVVSGHPLSEPLDVEEYECGSNGPGELTTGYVFRNYADVALIAAEHRTGYALCRHPLDSPEKRMSCAAVLHRLLIGDR